MTTPFHHLLDALPRECGVPILDGRYEILAELGHGGMGVVFKARHRGLDRDVAIKIPFPWLLEQAPTFRDRFFREAQAAARIDHPHVVRVFDVATAAGITYLVMEYVSGVTALEYVLSRGPLVIRTALAISRAAAKGLGAAHDAGLVHRDIKPANVLISSRSVKVADLGLAKPIESATDLTGSGQAMGTPRYMAPEQWADARAVDARADVYSLGATIYFLLAGKDGVRGANVSAVLDQLRGEGFPSISAERADLPRGLAELIADATAVDPKRRPENGKAVLERLDRLGRHEFALAGKQRPAPAPPPPAAPPIAAPVPKASRPRWVLAVTGLYAVLLASMYGFFFWHASVGDGWRDRVSILVIVALCLALQAFLAPVPLAAAVGKPALSKPIWLAFAGSLLAATGLALLVLTVVWELLVDPDRGDPDFFVAVAIVAATWLAWTVAFLRFRRGRGPLAQVLCLSQWLWRLSILSLVLAIPAHFVTRARGGWFAGLNTALAIGAFSLLLFLSLAPSVLVLFADRYLGRLPPSVREGLPTSRVALWSGLGLLAAILLLLAWLTQ